mgnify:CR=1 FL=1
MSGPLLVGGPGGTIIAKKPERAGLSGTGADCVVTDLVLRGGAGRIPGRLTARSARPAGGTPRGDAVPVRVEG